MAFAGSYTLLPSEYLLGLVLPGVKTLDTLYLH